MYRLTASPNSGYRFVRWEKNGSQISTDATTDVTIDGNATYTAYFEALGGQQYNISTAVSPAGAGTVTGAGTYYENTSATLVATSANEHLYFFDHWLKGGNSYAGGATITPTVTGEATYTAVFRVASNGTITTVADHGTVTGGGNYNGGDEVTLSVTPDDGYSFTQWSDGNTDNPRTVYVDGNHEYTAQFMYGVSLNLLAGCSPSSPLEYRVLLPDYEIYFRAGNSWSYGDGEEIPLSYTNTSASYIKDHGTTVTIGNDVYAYTHTEGDRKILELNFTGSNGKYYQIVLRGANYATDCTQNFDQTFTNLTATSSGTGWRILSADNGVTESAANAQFGPNHWDIYLPLYLDESKCGSEDNGVPSGIYPILDTDAEGTIRATIANSPARASGYWTCQGINQMHKLVTGYMDLVNRDGNTYAQIDGYTSSCYPLHCVAKSSSSVGTPLTINCTAGEGGSVNLVWHSSNCGDVTYTAAEMPQKFFNGNTITLTASANSGYEFWRWSDEDASVVNSAYGTSRNVTVSSDLTLQAIFRGEVTKHTVSITAPTHGTITVTYTEGTEKTLTEGSSDIAENTVLTITAEGVDGYHCTGLTVGGNSFTSGNTHTLTADVTIAATFAANTYTVAFDKNGGSGSMDSESFTYGTEKNIPANGFTAPTGKHFNGWNTLANGSGTAYAAGARGDQMTAAHESTVTLFAQWADNTFTIAFDGNGGSGSMGSESYTYDTEKNIPANGFTAPAGMHFTGWNTEDDGTGTAYAAGDRGDQITTENGVTVTLYAQWTANTYALTLDKGTDGTDDGSATATYNSNTLTGYTEATRDDGWTLQGYFTAASDGDMVINAEGELVANVDGYTDEDGKWIRTTGSMTLFAQWAEPLNTDLILVDDQQNDYYDALAATYYGDGTNPVSLTSITFQRTFKAKQWAAFSLPFDWYIEEESVLDGIVYRFTGATGNANDGVYVKFSGELDQNKLEAGKPYLINPTTDITSLTFTPNEENPTLQLSEYILDDDDNQVALYEDGGTESTVRFTATNRRYTLHGRYINEVENPNWKRYVFLNNNRLYYPNASGNTMRPFRGFFYVDGAGSGIAPRVHIVADGQVVTEIEMMETDQTADEQSTSEVRKYVENGVLIIERNGVKYNAQGGRL